jgi:hypothetical protein
LALQRGTAICQDARVVAILVCYLALAAFVTGVAVFSEPESSFNSKDGTRLAAGAVLSWVLLAWMHVPSSLPDLKWGHVEHPWRTFVTMALCISATIFLLRVVIAGSCRARAAAVLSLIFPMLVLYYILAKALS